MARPSTALIKRTTPRKYRMVVLLAMAWWMCAVSAMTKQRMMELREEARKMFSHGWEGYMKYGFPEDEVKPLSCTPHHRDRSNPEDIGRNDPLGDFSLTAVDTLSSLAVMAASSETDAEKFWRTVAEISRIYWYNAPKTCNFTFENCTAKTSSWGHFQDRSRASRGYDIDAKVQVFETTIRVLGGLLSAHLFAINVLPSLPSQHVPGFEYKNELLLLAHDLGERLLPALEQSPSGIPYPRINLRYGLPNVLKNPGYYAVPREAPFPHPGGRWSPVGEHMSEEYWEMRRSGKIKREMPAKEITENCAAGAGSLVLEFTALSRWTGDPRFERAAKVAFEAVWKRRSEVGLVGAGIDAETGLWVGAMTGVGAGVDSFFEYAWKGYILLSRTIREIGDEEGDRGDEWFLNVWEESRNAIERHMKNDIPTTWWGNVHLATGAVVQGASTWVDSLSAFFPGVLAGSGGGIGEMEGLPEAEKSSLFYTALWSRYEALPERWNTRGANIESGLSWYPGRPEFVESTYFLYRATKDPWYLYVGEMIMRDLKRHCWSRCGWAGLQDVRTGEKQDRMESFWLGETWTYLFLLFDEDHPLHKGDEPWVFTTEGHPLILPREKSNSTTRSFARVGSVPAPPRTCKNPHIGRYPHDSFFSPTASRTDLYHAAYFTRLHLFPRKPPVAHTLQPKELMIEIEKSYRERVNSTGFPWTLPEWLVPPNAICEPLPGRNSFELLFPMLEGLGSGKGNGKRVKGGIMITSLEGLRLGLHREVVEDGKEVLNIVSVAGLSVGREEKVFLRRGLVEGMRDVNFGVVTNSDLLDLVVELEGEGEEFGVDMEEFSEVAMIDEVEQEVGRLLGIETGLGDLLSRLGIDVQIKDFITSLSSLSSVGAPRSAETNAMKTLPSDARNKNSFPLPTKHVLLPASISTGKGAIDPVDTPYLPSTTKSRQLVLPELPFKTFFFADEACSGLLPKPAAHANVIVVKRGRCAFSEKIANIPDTRKIGEYPRLVVIVDYSLYNHDGIHRGTEQEEEEEEEEEEENFPGYDETQLVPPLIENRQLNFFGKPRKNQLPAVMVGGGSKMYEMLKKQARGMGVRRRMGVEVQGLAVENLIVL